MSPNLEVTFNYMLNNIYAVVCICISKESTQQGMGVVDIYDNLTVICSNMINIRDFVF